LVAPAALAAGARGAFACGSLWLGTATPACHQPLRRKPEAFPQAVW
jgi:hypothetical protein